MDLVRFQTRLAAHQPQDPSDLLVRSRAAVAAILRFDRGAEVLLIQRAEHPGDRWSGHISMPGGRQDDGDADLLATAIRETREEVGLELGDAPLLGRLGATRAIAKGRILPMTITPFVFHVSGDPVLTLNAEATAAFWFPLDRAAHGELDATYEYQLGPLPLQLACWKHDDRTVWGLTFEMLKALVELVR